MKKTEEKEIVTVKNKTTKVGFFSIGVVSLGLILATCITFKMLYKKPQIQTIKPIIKAGDRKILADGMIRSENETVLHFAVGGKLTYLPFKEGDRVKKGQTIASLDTYVLQKQLTATLNNYRATRDSFDQLNDNNKDNYLYALQANPYPYNYWNLGGISSDTKTNAINDMIKRLIDQSQAGLDNSVIQVEIANYALSLSSLQAPFDGVITHLDVTTPYLMVGPTTGFTIVDPDSYVFRANVSESDSNDIVVDSHVTVQLTGVADKKFDGLVSKIYPDKVTLPTGESVYQVDIVSDKMAAIAKYRQDGSALIDNKYQHTVVLIPSWTVLSKQYVWTYDQGKVNLKKVSLGETIGDMVQVSGITSETIITNPESVAAPHYTIL